MFRLKYFFSFVFVVAFSQCDNNTFTPVENKRWIEMSDANLIGFISIIDHNLWFMGSETIYMSSDHGKNLNMKMNGFKIRPSGKPLAYVGGMCKDENNYFYCAEVFDGVYRSTDQGENWFLVGLSDSTYSALTIISDYKGKLYAGTRTGVYLSTNKGMTWNNIYKEKNDMIIKSLAVSSDYSVLFSTYSGTVKISSNSGASWNTAYTGNSVGQLYKSKTGFIYLPSDAKLIRSLDGRQWEEIYQTQYSTMINVAETTNGSLYIGTWDGLLYSDSTGKNWKFDEDLPKGFQVNHLAIDDDGYGYVGSQGQGKGAYRTLMPLR